MIERRLLAVPLLSAIALTAILILLAPPAQAANVRAGIAPRASEVTAQVASASATSTEALAAELEALAPDAAAEVARAMSVEQAAGVLGHMSPTHAAALVEELTVAESVPMVTGMDETAAGAMLDEVSADYLSLMVDVMDEADMLRILPEVSPLHLWGVPFEKLAGRIPSVDSMHLAFWKRPLPPADLPALRLMDQTDDLSIYALPEARGSEWAVVVGSPAPIETIWAKFRSPASDLRIAVRSLLGVPAGAPSLPGGRIANSFFSVDVGEAGSPNVEVAAAIVFVDKSWLAANDVHKWSVQLARLNVDLGLWEPIPTKRIAEDAERVEFAVAIPGFSTLAITGSPTLEAPPVMVGALALDRRESLPNEPVSVTAILTNSGADEIVYTAVLWVDSSIETAQSVALAPGESAPVRFWVSRPVGDYHLRLDRSEASLSVRTDAAPAGDLVALPVTGGPSPPVGLLTAFVVAGAGLLTAGGLLVLSSSRTAGARPRRSAAPRYP